MDTQTSMDAQTRSVILAHVDCDTWKALDNKYQDAIVNELCKGDKCIDDDPLPLIFAFMNSATKCGDVYQRSHHRSLITPLIKQLLANDGALMYELLMFINDRYDFVDDFAGCVENLGDEVAATDAFVRAVRTWSVGNVAKIIDAGVVGFGGIESYFNGIRVTRGAVVVDTKHKPDWNPQVISLLLEKGLPLNYNHGEFVSLLLSGDGQADIEDVLLRADSGGDIWKMMVFAGRKDMDCLVDPDDCFVLSSHLNDGGFSRAVVLAPGVNYCQAVAMLLRENGGQRVSFARDMDDVMSDRRCLICIIDIEHKPGPVEFDEDERYKTVDGILYVRM